MFSTYLKACPRFERDSQTISSSPLPVSLREPDQVGISSHRASSPHGAKSIQHPNCRAKQMRPGSSLESSASFYERTLASLAQAGSQLVQWVFYKLYFTVFTVGERLHSHTVPTTLEKHYVQVRVSFLPLINKECFA